MKEASSKSFYNWFYIFYPIVNVFLKRPRRKLIKKVNELPLGNLLEVGVGTGKYLSNYIHETTAIDNSTKMLAQAKKYCNPSIKLYEMDAHEMSFGDSSFDYVALSFVISVVENPNVVLAEIHRILKPNGQLFILNHFPPQNFLGRMDKFFSNFSKVFNFNSAFQIEDLSYIEKFKIDKKLNLGFGDYYQLLVYKKG